ncbi:hypothetical protein KOW79_010277 [Hemibagrus wyckioides]|uniref:Apolipoprotein L3 n=1 Tax=Hemibagrus wyckioides TaxID=337641 RepID=A0A9D3NNS9_9TELE|nr:hypothetical protein KOW79_010277 [Hemibagrus wyckioides]
MEQRWANQSNSSEYMENNAEDSVGFLAMQCTNQTLREDRAYRRIYTTRRVLMAQQTWIEDSQQPVASQLLYQRNDLIPAERSAQRRQEDNTDFVGSWHSEESRKKYPDTTEDDAKAFTGTAENLKKSLCKYENLLSEQEANLQGHIIELHKVASSIGKLQRELKQTGIGGGVAATVGVLTTVGLVLAPVTSGITAAVAGVGSLVAAAGGLTGILAAVTSKVQNNKEKEKVKKILKEYCTQIAEILRCVNFISTNIECLKTYDPSTLKGVEQKAVKMAHMLGDNVGAIKAVSKSSGLTNGFMMGSDMYFNKEDFKLLKKGKLAKQIHIVANKMQASLDELMKFKKLMQSCNVKPILIQINVSAFPDF